MGEAVGQVLSFAVGVALSPIAVVAIVIMLATPRGKVNGPAFLIGWMLGLAITGTVLLLVSGSMDMGDGGDPSTRSSYIKLALGIVLLGVAVRRFRARAAGGGDQELPGWLKTLDGFNAVKATGLAALLSGINPKNLVLTAGAAMAISQTGASTGGEAVALAVFVVLGSLGVAIPLGIFFLMRDRAEALLGGLRTWMTRENATIIGIICLIIGAKLIGDAISGLSA
ncbi:MAG: GAP family protein [Thermoleophilia bacterium]|nr:GAP family protein [Thermoleophilia bacterium]